MIEGPAGTALRVRALDRPGAAVVDQWLLHCPGQGPAWEWFDVACFHLRQVDGGPGLGVVRPGASHEVLVRALDPDGVPDVERPGEWRHVVPLNVVHQIVVSSDTVARSVTGLAVELVLTGVLCPAPPWTGYSEPWASTLDRLSRELDPAGQAAGGGS